jgi:LacI family transcriptional regulator
MAGKTRSTTLEDIARHAGVSTKTVSNVVRDWPYVGDETRRKVQEAIEALGYRPNRAARSLVTGKTETVGIIVPDVGNPFFGTAIRGCEEALFAGGYHVFLCNSNEEADRERYYMESLLSRCVDAVILWGAHIASSDLERMIGTETPLVTIEMGDEPVTPNHSNFNVDNLAGARLATEHLLQQGHRRIAHLAAGADRVTSALRAAGYRQAMEAAGLPVIVVRDQPTIGGGSRAAHQILTATPPEAIFCYNDLMAIGAMLTARQLGFSLPGDLALVGFDDITISAMIEPPLTTMHIAQYDLGHLAGQEVLRRLSGQVSSSRLITVPVELVVRGSSGTALFGEQERKAMFDSLAESGY